MPVERTTPQLVKKGKGKKRPGYRGPGGYQGGRSSGPAGGASAGGNYGGNKNPSQNYGGSGQGGGTRPNPHTKSGTSKTSKVTAKDFERSKREFIQNLNHNNAIRAAQTGQKFTPYKGGSRPKGGMSGLGNLLMSGIGALMGIPGLGLLTGGFNKLKGGLANLNETLGDFREKTTGYRTQKEYEDARTQRQLQGRLDNLYDRKAKGKGFSQKNIDMLEAMGLQPSTAQNVLTGRDLKGFTDSRMGLQTPSDPFAMSIGPQAVNVPAGDAVSSYGLQDYGYDYGTAGAAVPTDMLAPTPVENVIQDVYSGAKNIGAKGNSFLDSLYNADLINQLGYQAFQNYPSDSATGPLSDARHMAAMNELSKSLSPMDNKFGNFIGDTLAYGAGLINEVPALARGFNKENFDAIKEDLAANYAGTYGTPNTTTAQQIYNQVFDTNKFASTGFAEGGIASLSNRRG